MITRTYTLPRRRLTLTVTVPDPSTAYRSAAAAKTRTLLELRRLAARLPHYRSADDAPTRQIYDITAELSTYLRRAIHGARADRRDSIAANARPATFTFSHDSGPTTPATCITLRGAYEHTRASLRAHRTASRIIPGCDCGRPTCRDVPLIRRSPGRILALRLHRLRERLGLPKSPSSAARHVGLEIECFIPSARLAAFTAALLSSPLASRIQLKSDGSLRASRDSCEPVELALCTPLTAYAADVRTLTNLLSQYDATVNRSCGLHVHLDQRNTPSGTIRARARRLVLSQGLLYQLVPPSRHTNDYCKRSRLASLDRADRYHAINFWPALRTHNTIEVRLHSATIDAEKILNWSALLHVIQDDADLDTYRRTPRGLRTWRRILRKHSANLSAYVTARAAQFRPRPDDALDYGRVGAQRLDAIDAAAPGDPGYAPLPNFSAAADRLWDAASAAYSAILTTNQTTDRAAAERVVTVNLTTS